MTESTNHPILVLGNGGWGTALAMTLHSNGHPVRVWGHDAAYCEEIEATRENRKYLPGVKIPGGILFGADSVTLAAEADTVFSVIPTQFLRTTLQSLQEHLPPRALYVTCSKGFERNTLALPSRIIQSCFDSAGISVLSGPSHAEETSRGLPTTVVVASEDDALSAKIQQIISTDTFRVYTSSDARGVEVAGASKNVIALAAGISD